MNVHTQIAGSVRLMTLAALGVCAACGGGDSPTAPSSSTSTIVQSTGAVATSATTITIGATGAVAPSSVTIAVGQSVTFVNSDTRAHDMSSDPHPTHVHCPSMGNVGVLAPGQTKISFGFAGRGTCGFHDHNNPDTASLKGTIVIQ